MHFSRNVPSLPRLRRSLVVRVVRRYADANAGHWATNMAWNALFAFIPILLVLATAVALLFNAQSFELYLAREMATLFHARPDRVLTVFDSIRGKFWPCSACSASPACSGAGCRSSAAWTAASAASPGSNRAGSFGGGEGRGHDRRLLPAPDPGAVSSRAPRVPGEREAVSNFQVPSLARTS